MTDRELMQQALEALETDEHDMVPDKKGHMIFRKEVVIAALRERLAQPEQEPVVWMYQDKSTHEVRFQKHMRGFVDHGATYETPLYTTPPRREWVGLTDDEIAVICGECAASAHRTDDISYARAIEAKLKEKNNG